MKVLIVEPGKYPREADIEHTLVKAGTKSWQRKRELTTNAES